MNNILIAIDYNPSAEKVAETGYAIAKSLQAKVTIVHVITEAAFYAMEYSPIMGYQGGYTSGTVELINDIKTQAEEFLAATVKHLGEDTIVTKVLDGDTANEILKFAIEENADLIVIGSHSHHGLDKLFGTDIAADILKNSKVPVLSIPTSVK